MQARWVPLVPQGVALADRAIAGLLGCALGSRQVEVAFGRHRQAACYTYLGMRTKWFVFSNVRFFVFFFSLVTTFELPYALLVIFQSCQIRQRKPDN